MAHDGSYSDPFELSDEVRFVEGESTDLMHLVAAGANNAGGRFVHVLADGLEATIGWTDEALEKFEHFDAGCVIPVIRQASNDRVVACGWCDGIDRICKPLQRSNSRVAKFGAYIHASFWRRDLLRSLIDACQLVDAVEASYAFGSLLRLADWRSVIADDCAVRHDSDVLPWNTTSFKRGRRLRSIESVCSTLDTGSSASPVVAAATAGLINIARPGGWMECLGQAFSSFSLSSIEESIDCRAIVSRNESEQSVIKLPTQSLPESDRVRRAA